MVKIRLIVEGKKYAEDEARKEASSQAEERSVVMCDSADTPNSIKEPAPGPDGREKSEGAPKKKRIVAVFRPQNSRSGMMPRRSGQNTAGRPQGPGARSQRPSSANSGTAGNGRGTARRPQESGSSASARPQSGASSAQRGQRQNNAPSSAARKPAEQRPRVHFVGAMTGTDRKPENAPAANSIAAAQAAAQAEADRVLNAKVEENRKAAQEAAAASARAEAEKAAAARAEAVQSTAAPKAEERPAAAETAVMTSAAAPVEKKPSAPVQTGAAETAAPAVSSGAAKTSEEHTEHPQLRSEDAKNSGAPSSDRSGSRRGGVQSSDRGGYRSGGAQSSDRGGYRSGSASSSERGGYHSGSASSSERGGYRSGSTSSDRGGYRSGGQSSDRGGYRSGGGQSSERGGYRSGGASSSNRGGYRSGGASSGNGSYSRSGGAGQSRLSSGSGAGPSRGFAGGKPSAAGKGRSGDFQDSMGAKSGDKQRRSSSRKTEREKEKEKFSRFDQDDRVQSGAKKKKDPNRAGAFHRPEPVKAQPEEEQIKTIVLPDTLTLRDLADKMKMQPSALIKKLFLQGKMVTVNQELSYEDAEAIALDYDILCEHEVKKDLIAELLKDVEDPEEKLVSRAPVVCVMGHVDHGKTSLLDAIRNTHVSDREAGGITQHIGASVIHYDDRSITFLDTPGHEAFTAMRMRGANSTDIAVLVVAADDGVMPQTVEAINHAKAANIEIIVAINKIDKPGANIDRVKQELTEYGLVAEDWGGSTTMVPVSAKTHEGIDSLLEMILLTADVLELKANPDRRARGVVIEAKLDKGRGPVASLLIQKGTLHVGDPICAGACHGKVRAMTDDKGRTVKEAGPSTPVEVIGFSDVPGAGEIFLSPETDKEAKSFAETFITVGREKMIEDTKSRMSLDDLFSQIKEGNLKDLNLIVKADVQGSVEALKQSLEKLSNEEVVVKIIHSGVGAINESDVTLAGASSAIIIGFNVRPDALAKSTAEHEGVEIKLYRVIYDAINDVENAMKGMLEPIYEEKVTGHVEVRQIFKASGVGSIAGSYVLDGVVQRGSKARITRGKDQIFDGEIASLKRFKDDVKEVKAGYECGLVFEGFNDIAEGDQVEVYKMVEVPRT